MKEFLLSIIFMCAITLSCTESFASGKLMYEPTHNMDTGKLDHKLGLSVWEPIAMGKLFLNSYLGTVHEDDAQDFKSVDFKNMLIFQPISSLQLGIGIETNYNPSTDEYQNYSSAKLAYQIW